VTGIVAITLDGVLRSTTNGGSLRTGLMLYRALEQQASLAVIADWDTEEAATYWLTQNGLTKHSYLVLFRASDPEDPGERRVAQITRLKESSSVDLLIDPDPAVAQAVMASGTPVLLSLHPIYARPEFRPDFKSVAKPWDTMTQDIDRQMEMRLADAREVETL
jgi:hypothetical protein